MCVHCSTCGRGADWLSNVQFSSTGYESLCLFPNLMSYLTRFFWSKHKGPRFITITCMTRLMFVLLSINSVRVYFQIYFLIQLRFCKVDEPWVSVFFFIFNPKCLPSSVRFTCCINVLQAALANLFLFSGLFGCWSHISAEFTYPVPEGFPAARIFFASQAIFFPCPF